MAQENFLVDINLNRNQLLNLRLQNLSTNPSTPPEGFTYYSSTDKTVYTWNGSTWVDLGQVTTPGVTNLTLGTATGTTQPINNSSGTGVILPSATTTTAGLLSAADKTKLDTLTTGTNGTVTSVAASISGALSVSGSPITTSGTLAFSWTGSNTQYVRGDGTLFQLINDSTTTTTSTWSSTKIAAEIATITSAIAGGLINKGGYNAATNTPALDATPIAGIKNGWTYVVSTGGTFFTEDVQPGDMLIANQDNPTTLAHWTRVNKNIPDIVQASTTQQGIIELATQAEVNAGTDTERAVTPATLATYIGGTVGGYAANFGDGTSTTFNIVHGLNTTDVIVQITEVATGETVIMQVRRTNTTTVNIQCNVAPTTNQYRCIIKK